MDVTATPAAPRSITTGTLVARGVDSVTGAPLEVTAGRVLRTGVRDINKVGWELIRSTFDPPRKEAWGMVAFVRDGDAWTAVELLEKSATGTTPLWLHTHVKDVRIADGITVDAVWQVSNYGGDYSRIAKGWVAPRG